ncbi:uncharacterized protein LOC123502605 [Portunus trituberculatus]|uniref:uncharacterized protein LOC123502605 n=1 Tax=Portunus trituberculatus TaxID=210409 RepID=UPI001E1CF309|nr:uncharacterized protein LOC123502605 [Portunus trituberculatus]XP_045107705.1 uncharacterized protein LOC123502605 [Portunus trituberculatus]
MYPVPLKQRHTSTPITPSFTKGGTELSQLLIPCKWSPSSASAWDTQHSPHTCTAYVCLLIPSALGVGLFLRPLSISCSTAHASTPHCTALRSWLSALGIDLLTLLAASGVHPSRQSAVLRLTCAFLRKTGQLSRL